jgi:hypothetical protein
MRETDRRSRAIDRSFGRGAAKTSTPLVGGQRGSARFFSRDAATLAADNNSEITWVIERKFDYEGSDAQFLARLGLHSQINHAFALPPIATEEAKNHHKNKIK